MLYGIFSDVHANLEALNAVLGVFSDAGVKSHIFCGDLVGYGPDPEPCVARVRGLANLSAVCGNHDLGVVGSHGLEWFNPYARTAVLWTRAHLSRDSKTFLEGLPLKIEGNDFTLVHGTPRKPPEEYLLTAAQFKDNMSQVKIWPLFVGHSHMPLCFQVSDLPGGVETTLLESEQPVKIFRDGKIIPTAFNPGSVGQPRDHDPRAACAIYDSSDRSFRVIRVAYDISRVQSKIRDIGLPEYLALRLAFGQ